MEQIVFGPFCLDVGVRRLLRDGVELDLRPQAFCALRALIRNAGRYIDYPQMIQEAWDGNRVSRHTVAVTIGEAKKILGEYGSWIHYRPKLGYRLEIPKNEDLIRKGWHFCKRYTREGFDRAIACFEQAAREDSADFRAFEGLSLSYLILGAYGMRPPREMYAKFKEANGRAVALKGLTPELRADRAHAMHVFERRVEEAEEELIRARQEDPTLTTVYGHLTMLYASSGRFEEASAALEQAYRTDPLWPVLPAMEILVRLCRRDFEGAVESGRTAVDLHPYLPMGRFLFSQALEVSGRLEEALAQCRRAQVISPDMQWLRAEEAACLVKLGRRAEARPIVEEIQQLRITDYVDAYGMALVREALGQRDEALREMQRAYDENSATLFILRVDSKFDALRADPRFARLEELIFGDSKSSLRRAAS